MKKNILFCITTLFLQPAFAQELYKAADLTAEHVFTGNCEGPAVDKSGNLYVVNFEQDGTIAIIKPGKAPELFVKLPAGSTGNGLRFDKEGDLFVADFTGHNVLQVDMKTKAVTVVAHSEEFYSPNDVAISNSGILFLSDPSWKLNTGNIWRLTPDGRLSKLESGMGTTNGIEVSPDDKLLYVNESNQRNIWVYNLDESGNVTNKRLFASFSDFGLDGMRCDAKGNLYVTRYDKGVVAIFNPEGKLLREVQMKGKKTSNVTFGGKDGRIVYVTLQDRGCVEYFRAEEAGAR